MVVLIEIHSSESGLNTSNRCFQITISPQVRRNFGIIYYLAVQIDDMTCIVVPKAGIVYK